MKKKNNWAPIVGIATAILVLFVWRSNMTGAAGGDAVGCGEAPGEWSETSAAVVEQVFAPKKVEQIRASCEDEVIEPFHQKYRKKTEVTLEDGYVAGTLQGQSSVGSDGGFNYTIPIDVPPGRNGMQPQISIKYNSNGRDGFLGPGWSVTGFDQVHRTPLVYGFDGEAGPIMHDRKEPNIIPGRFAWNGRRLIHDGGDCQNGFLFRTQESPFDEVTWQTDNSNNCTDQGAPSDSYWKIKQISGRTRVFSSRMVDNVHTPHIYYQADNGKKVNYAWPITAEYDRFGNSIDYSYEALIGSEALGPGDALAATNDIRGRGAKSAAAFRPKRIVYTGLIDPERRPENGQRIKAGSRVLIFCYDQERKDRPPYFRMGISHFSTRLLTSLEAHVLDDGLVPEQNVIWPNCGQNNDTLAWKYKLEYRQPNPGTLSAPSLASIRKCVFSENGSEACQRPTRFISSGRPVQDHPDVNQRAFEFNLVNTQIPVLAQGGGETGGHLDRSNVNSVQAPQGLPWGQNYQYSPIVGDFYRIPENGSLNFRDFGKQLIFPRLTASIKTVDNEQVSCHLGEAARAGVSDWDKLRSKLETIKDAGVALFDTVTSFTSVPPNLVGGFGSFLQFTSAMEGIQKGAYDEFPAGKSKFICEPNHPRGATNGGFETFMTRGQNFAWRDLLALHSGDPTNQDFQFLEDMWPARLQPDTTERYQWRDLLYNGYQMFDWQGDYQQEVLFAGRDYYWLFNGVSFSQTSLPRTFDENGNQSRPHYVPANKVLLGDYNGDGLKDAALLVGVEYPDGYGGPCAWICKDGGDDCLENREDRENVTPYFENREDRENVTPYCHMREGLRPFKPKPGPGPHSKRVEIYLSESNDRNGGGNSGFASDGPYTVDLSWGSFDNNQVLDLDGDGVDELFLSGINGSADVHRLSGFLDGKAESKSLLKNGKLFPGAARHVRAGDFNGDGLHDLALMGSSFVQLLISDGTGNFRIREVVPPQIYTFHSGFMQRSFFMDVNGDGRTDVVYPVLTETEEVWNEDELFEAWGMTQELDCNAFPLAEAIEACEIMAQTRQEQIDQQMVVVRDSEQDLTPEFLATWVGVRNLMYRSYFHADPDKRLKKLKLEWVVGTLTQNNGPMKNPNANTASEDYVHWDIATSRLQGLPTDVDPLFPDSWLGPNHIIPADLNSDGLQDILFDGEGAEYFALMQQPFRGSDGQMVSRPNLITKVVNGFGHQTKIEYKDNGPKHCSAVRRASNFIECANYEGVPEETRKQLRRDLRVRPLVYEIQEQVGHDEPRVGAKYNRQRYFYRGGTNVPTLNLSLGFEQTRVDTYLAENPEQLFTSQTTYYDRIYEFDSGLRTFPFAGRVSRVETQNAEGDFLHRQELDYLLFKKRNFFNQPSYHLASHRVTDYEYDPGLNGAPFRASQVQRRYRGTKADDDGRNYSGPWHYLAFVENTIHRTSSGAKPTTNGRPQKEKMIKFKACKQTECVDNWLWDRAESETEKSYGDNGDISQRKTLFEYETVENSPNGRDRPWVLTSVSRDTDDPNQQQRSEFVTDPFGNVVLTKTIAHAEAKEKPKNKNGQLMADEKQVRNTIVQYGREAYFPRCTINGLGHVKVERKERVYGNNLSVTDANGVTQFYAYDGFGRETGHWLPVVPKSGRVPQERYRVARKEYSYVNALRPYLVAETVEDTSERSEKYLDVLARPRETVIDLSVNRRSVESHLEYNGQGQVSREARPYWFGDEPVHFTQRSYDAKGRVVLEERPDGGTTRTTYSGLSIWSSVTRNNAQLNTETQHDLSGRIIVVRNANQNEAERLEFDYGPFDQIVEIRSGPGVTRTNEYDTWGRIQSFSDADMGDWTNTYNGFDELASVTNAREQITTQSYDVLGRLVARDADDQSSEWKYDLATNGLGLLAYHKTKDVERRFEYDAFGRETKETLLIDKSMPHNIRRTYNDQGQLWNIAYPGPGGKKAKDFVISHSYSAYGWLESISSFDGRKTYWTAEDFDAAGRLTEETYGNGVVTNRSYHDEIGALATLVTQKGGTQFQNQVYSYDQTGNLTYYEEMAPGRGVRVEYKYDLLNRLVSTGQQSVGSKNISSGNFRYQYDALGNLIKKSFKTKDKRGRDSLEQRRLIYQEGKKVVGGPHAVSKLLNAKGKQVQSFAYDKNGNMTSNGKSSIRWTSYDRPSAVVGKSSNEAFTYDADYKRVTKSTPAEFTIYMSGLAEISTNPLKKRTEFTYFINKGNRLVATEKRLSGEVHYHHGNHLNSAQVITDKKGKMARQSEYLPFGVLDKSSGPAIVSRGFTGEEHDDSGLIHLGARLYDPSIGRFISADPTIPDPFDLQHYNRYSYVLNNPLRYTDPTGYRPIPTKWGAIKMGVRFWHNQVTEGRGAFKKAQAAKAERHAAMRVADQKPWRNSSGELDGSDRASFTHEQIFGNQGAFYTFHQKHGAATEFVGKVAGKVFMTATGVTSGGSATIAGLGHEALTTVHKVNTADTPEALEKAWKQGAVGVGKVLAGHGIGKITGDAIDAGGLDVVTQEGLKISTGEAMGQALDVIGNSITPRSQEASFIEGM